jgi:NMD protein affecting ribosome stability and mRNA decay
MMSTFPRPMPEESNGFCAKCGIEDSLGDDLCSKCYDTHVNQQSKRKTSRHLGRTPKRKEITSR